jgi:hypothetical protein
VPCTDSAAALEGLRCQRELGNIEKELVELGPMQDLQQGSELGVSPNSCQTSEIRMGTSVLRQWRQRRNKNSKCLEVSGPEAKSLLPHFQAV